MVNRIVIRLKTTEDVKEFSKIIAEYSFEADAGSSEKGYIVDAKSILGLFSLDLSQSVILTIHGDDQNEINNFRFKIERFIIE